MLGTISIFNKSKIYQITDIKDNDRRYQLVHCYDFSKTSASFRYQLKRLCDVLSWSFSIRYQLVHRYDVSNWSVLFTYQWDVAKKSKIGPSYSRTRWDFVMMYGPKLSNWSLKWVNLLWVLGSTFFSMLDGSVSLRHQLARRYNV